jgi:hypothetical protein
MSPRGMLLASLWGLLVPSSTPSLASERAPLAPRPLRATEGGLEPLPGGRLRIEAPKVRAVVDTSLAAPDEVRRVELRFTYLGPTRVQRPLQSGEQRRQVGLKLRAQDGCNLVYVMWRIAPKPGLVVSVKHNPGAHHSDDCGTGGYQTVKPLTSSAPPALVPGEPHTLRAELRGTRLGVWVDDTSVWEGALPPEVLSFDGPVGLRTDNGRFEVDLRSNP